MAAAVGDVPGQAKGNTCRLLSVRDPQGARVSVGCPAAMRPMQAPSHRGWVYQTGSIARSSLSQPQGPGPQVQHAWPTHVDDDSRRENSCVHNAR
eukprot:4637008-Pyramimonas_sp.AAC.1